VNGTANESYNALVIFDASVWNEWWLATTPNVGAALNLQIIDGDANGIYGPPKRYLAIGNWSRYVRPGWVRIGVSGSLPGIFGVAAFKNPSTGAFAIIAINNSGSDIPNVTFAISGGRATGSVVPYVTSGTPVGAIGSDGNLSAGSQASGVPASLPVTNGMFTSTVPYGVTTFVGPN
jgi:glucuronoarabinoxylan endo-1,4-beta-xylanase